MAFNRNIPFNDLPDLPPPNFAESPEILRHLVIASRHLGELNGLCTSLPDPDLLINTIVLQESKDSTAIENIVTTQDELYRAAAEEESASHPAKEVLNYREALYKGLQKMQAQNNLLITSTMVEIVQTIKRNNAGIRNVPGTALKNAVNGEVMYTPPCCQDILREKLATLEKFINDSDVFPADPLIKMAFIHYQFEAIHPFADGNGRTGRIVNALYMVQQNLLQQPVLYLSDYIMKNKNTYYQRLRDVTENSNWHDWIIYILTAVIETSQLTGRKIKGMLLLKDSMQKEMKDVLGQSYTHELLQLLFTLPYLKIEILEKAGIAHRQTASVWLKKLANSNILNAQKIRRTTYYVNHRLISLLSND